MLEIRADCRTVPGADTVFIGVTNSIHIVIHIAVTTFAGIGGIALLGAGGSGDGFAIVVGMRFFDGNIIG